jgi:chloramphenicol-sensitive protein RarD
MQGEFSGSSPQPAPGSELEIRQLVTPASRGFLGAAAAFAIWGVFPLYFHPLREVSALQIIAHRVVWSCVFVFAWVAIRGELATIRAALANPGLVWRLAVTAMLISLNWLAYVWGVTNGRVVETSLGYFIGPLVNVLLGVVLLAERLTAAQWTAVALAAAGVTYLTVMAGGLPWLALVLAFLFAIYGLIRKIVKIESLPGLAIETLVLAPVATGYLLWCEYAGTGALGHTGPAVAALLLGSGPLTAIALFLFAFGTRLLPYSTVGLLQFIAPTLQFACGVFALHEPFGRTRAIGFSVIWVALLIYAGEGLRLSGKEARP